MQQKPKETRSRLRKCFKKTIFSFVPLEIWKDVLFFADGKSLNHISKTCWAFKELVECALQSIFNLALSFRKGNRIDLANEFLLKCAKNNHSTAMFHLGFAFMNTGWGVRTNSLKAADWIKKSAQRGNFAAMGQYAQLLGSGIIVPRDLAQSKFWGREALSSKNSFAIGYCLYLGLGIDSDKRKALSFFEIAAGDSNEPNEFAETWLGQCEADNNNLDKSFSWYLKAAEEGSASAQYSVGVHYDLEGDERCVIWYEKAANQGCEDSKDMLHYKDIDYETHFAD